MAASTVSTKVQQCAIYVRISEDSVGDGEGVERQERLCRDLAARLGYEVSAVYDDNDLGASSLSKKPRPGYNKMLEDIRSGAVSMVLAYSNSRLTRRPKEWGHLIELAQAGKVEFKTVVSGQHDLATADGRAVAMTIAVWDGAEAERLSERQKAANLDRAKKGIPFTGGKRPFGWNKDKLTLNEPEAQLIREAVEAVTNGDGPTAVARRWNEAGATTVSGNPWTQEAVRKVLTSPRLAGVRVLNGVTMVDSAGKPVDPRWEPVVSREQWETMMASWQSRRRETRSRKNHLLTEILRCGICGRKLYGNFLENNRSAYVCKNGGHLAVSAHRLEEYVKVMVGLQWVRVFEWQRMNPEEKPTSQPVDVWPQEDELLALTEDAKTMMADYAANPKARGFILAQVDEVQEKIEVLRNQRAVWKAERKKKEKESEVDLLLTYGMDLPTWLQLMEAAGQLLIRGSVDSIIIKPTDRGRRHMEERVQFVWNSSTEPWGDGEPGPLNRRTEEWLAQWEQENRMKSYNPDTRGASSPKMAEVLSILRESPTIPVKEMAERVGLSQGHANKLMVYAKSQLALAPDFAPEEAPKDTASRRFVEVAELLRENPAVTGKEVCERLDISSGYASTLMRLVREKLEANPEHDFSQDRPSTLPSRSRNKRIPEVLELLRQEPQLNGVSLARKLGVGETYAQQLLKAARSQMI